LGDQVTIGHLAKLCSCEIQDQTLVGIGATINAGARIGRNCLVGAGTVVEAGQEFSDGWLIFGNPGKAVRLLTVDQIEGVRLNAERYVENARRFRLGLKQVLPGN
jgi:carbonic anhydrase/acetyltransferase-like protein (isoleucine patch superfamily)